MKRQSESEGYAISGRGLSRSFGKTKAVDAVDVTVKPGTLVGLIGPDGAGKTTLMRVLAGVLRPDAGSVQVAGGLGYVPQTFSLYQDMSVNENLDFYGTLYGLMGEALAARKARVLEFASLSEYGRRLGGELSGGMKQRLALAVALIHEPSVIVMDEPTNGVDPVARKDLWNVVRTLVNSGSGALVSTQYLEEGEYCDTVALMARGRFVAHGTPEELRALLPGQVLQASLDGVEGGAGASRLAVSKALSGVPGVSHIRRLGASVRFFLAQGQSEATAAEALRAAGLGSVALTPTKPSLQDVYVWLAGSPEREEGGARLG